MVEDGLGLGTGCLKFGELHGDVYMGLEGWHSLAIVREVHLC